MFTLNQAVNDHVTKMGEPHHTELLVLYAGYPPSGKPGLGTHEACLIHDQNGEKPKVISETTCTWIKLYLFIYLFIELNCMYCIYYLYSNSSINEILIISTNN